MDNLRLLGFGPSGWGMALAWAMATTLAVSLAAFALGSVIGALLAAARLGGAGPVRMLAGFYTFVTRGVPELLLIYLVYFGASSVVTAAASAFGHGGFVGVPSFVAGTVAVGVISGAYQGEAFRGAFFAIRRGELEAARACGMSAGLRLRRIVVPQVLRNGLEALGNVWQLSLKDSALVSVTGLAELMRTAQVAAGSTRSYFLFFVTAAIAYLVLTSLSEIVLRRLESRMSLTARPLPAAVPPGGPA